MSDLSLQPATPRETTARLELVSVTAAIARAAADADHARLSTLLDAQVPPDWPHEFLDDALPKIADELERGPHPGIYGMWLIVQRDPRALVGTAGLKSPPVDGRVDFGYGLVASARKRGYATEASARLLDLAFADPATQRVAGETMPDLTDSIRVMQRLGMKLVARDATGFSGEPGVIRYEITRSDWARRACD